MVGTLRHRLIDRLGREYPILALLQQKDRLVDHRDQDPVHDEARRVLADDRRLAHLFGDAHAEQIDRKSTRLNSSHLVISYAVFCLKKKKKSSIKIRSMHMSNITQYEA